MIGVRHPLWRKAPTRLVRRPALLAAVMLGALLVTVVSTAYPLFLSASDSNILASAVAQPDFTRYGTGLEYRSTDIPFDAKAPDGGSLLQERQGALEPVRRGRPEARAGRGRPARPDGGSERPERPRVGGPGVGSSVRRDRRAGARGDRLGERRGRRVAVRRRGEAAQRPPGRHDPARRRQGPRVGHRGRHVRAAGRPGTARRLLADLARPDPYRLRRLLAVSPVPPCGRAPAHQPPDRAARTAGRPGVHRPAAGVPAAHAGRPARPAGIARRAPGGDAGSGLLSRPPVPVLHSAIHGQRRIHHPDRLAAVGRRGHRRGPLGGSARARDRVAVRRAGDRAGRGQLRRRVLILVPTHRVGAPEHPGLGTAARGGEGRGRVRPSGRRRRVRRVLDRRCPRAHDRARRPDRARGARERDPGLGGGGSGGPGGDRGGERRDVRRASRTQGSSGPGRALVAVGARRLRGAHQLRTQPACGRRPHRGRRREAPRGTRVPVPDRVRLRGRDPGRPGDRPRDRVARAGARGRGRLGAVADPAAPGLVHPARRRVPRRGRHRRLGVRLGPGTRVVAADDGGREGGDLRRERRPGADGAGRRGADGFPLPAHGGRTRAGRRSFRRHPDVGVRPSGHRSHYVRRRGVLGRSALGRAARSAAGPSQPRAERGAADRDRQRERHHARDDHRGHREGRRSTSWAGP